MSAMVGKQVAFYYHLCVVCGVGDWAVEMGRLLTIVQHEGALHGFGHFCALWQAAMAA